MSPVKESIDLCVTAPHTFSAFLQSHSAHALIKDCIQYQYPFIHEQQYCVCLYIYAHGYYAPEVKFISLHTQTTNTHANSRWLIFGAEP